MNPGVPGLETVLATLCAWCHIANLIQVCALLSHDFLLRCLTPFTPHPRCRIARSAGDAGHNGRADVQRGPASASLHPSTHPTELRPRWRHAPALAFLPVRAPGLLQDAEPG